MVIQETQLKEGIRLRWLISILIRDIEQLLKMLDCLLHIAVLGVRLCQLLVGLRLLLRYISLLRDLEEFVQVLDGAHQIALALIDVADFLVAFSFLGFFLCPL